MKRNCRIFNRAVFALLVLLSVAEQGLTTPIRRCVQVGKRHVCQVVQVVEIPIIYDAGSGFDRYVWKPARRDASQPVLTKKEKASPKQGNNVRAGFVANIVGDATVGQRRAINYCMELARDWWPSPVPVDVFVNFSSVGGTRVLGSARATSSWDIDGSIYQVALAEAVLGQRLNGGEGDERIISQYDVSMTLNTEAPWYDGLDARPSAMTYDLVTVCLHELVHGLFMSGGNLGIGRGADGISYVGYYANKALEGRFDSFMANGDGCNIRGYADRPLQLGAVLTGNNLWFASPTGDPIARLYAPHPYIRGSSMYHLSEATYGAGGNNDLMTPVIGTGYAQHNIGPVVRTILQVILDTNSTSAHNCDNIKPPVSDNTTVDGGGARTPDSGPVDNDTPVDSGNGFSVKLGSRTISGWILVGAGAAIFVSIFIVTFAVRAVITAAARRRAPPRRVQREERLQVSQGGNAGGIV